MRLAVVLARLRGSERDLDARFQELADRHPEERDVVHVATDLAAWCRAHAESLDEVLGEGDGPAPAVPSAESDDDPGLALLSDLRETYRAAAGVAVDWDMVGQAAHSLRDERLLAVVGRCAPQTQRQLTWLRSTIGQIAGQTLTAGTADR